LISQAKARDDEIRPEDEDELTPADEELESGPESEVS
ncbi:MAG: hypothetical protein ACI9F9_002183, partial [Candidatus Paceibacteria bacterium]